MKIAHLVTVFLPYKSGIGNICYQQVFELAKLGHEVTVFTPDYSQAINDRELTTNNRFQIIYLRPLIKYGNAAWVPNIIKELNNFDLIHIHYPFIGGAEKFIFSKINKPVIIQYHMDLGMPKILSFLVKPYNLLVTNNIFKQAQKILVSSGDYAKNSKQIGSFFNKNKEKFIEIPYGVDLDKFKPENRRKYLLEKLGIKENEKIILFVGGLDKAHYFKGLDVLLEAYKLLFSTYYFLDSKLIIVGKGSEKAKYERMAKKLGIEDNVIFADEVDNQELPDYYNLADVFVLPSINNLESFGIVLIEAMACGKPCLASNLPGVRTVVDDTKTGFLVEPNNVDDLTEKIKNILENEILAKEMGQAGRSKVENKYNQINIIGQIENLYKTLISK